jgi:NAD(P) transhydrogenase subunit alpha
MVTHNGKINWPPAPLQVSPTAGGNVKKVAPPTAEETALSNAEAAKKKAVSTIITMFVLGGLLLLVGAFAPSEFIQHFTVFVLAIFVGWQVISDGCHECNQRNHRYRWIASN